MSPARRALVSVPAVAALAWVAVLSASAGSASLVASGAPDAGTLQRALDRAPADPELHELLGIAARESDQAASFAHFERALVLRPTFPYTWANFAQARYGFGVTDEVFEAALVRASELGPNETEVQATVALYGLAVWNEVRPETREAIDRMVAAGMKRDPATMLRIAERRGRLDVACRHVERARLPGDMSQLCK